MKKKGRRRPQKSHIRMWKVWGGILLLSTLLEASVPCRATDPKRCTYKGRYTSGHVPGFFNPLGINQQAF